MRASGTIEWMSPELIWSSKSSFASDVYAFGVMMWEVFSDGNIPFRNLIKYGEVANSSNFVLPGLIVAGERPDLLSLRKDTPTICLNLIKQTWSNILYQRPTATQIHDTLQGNLN
jgi:serine/threonine protein kinase